MCHSIRSLDCDSEISVSLSSSALNCIVLQGLYVVISVGDVLGMTVKCFHHLHCN